MAYLPSRSRWTDGEMPLRQYTLLHPAAKLTAEEREILVAALVQMSGDDRRGRDQD